LSAWKLESPEADSTRAPAVVAAELLDHRLHPRRGNAGLLERVGDLWVLEETDEQLVDGEMGVPAPLLCRLRAADDLDQRRGRRDGIRQRRLRGQPLECGGHDALEGVGGGDVVSPGRVRDGLAEDARPVRGQRRGQV